MLKQLLGFGGEPEFSAVRVFELSRGVFAVIGLVIVVTVALPVPRDWLLTTLQWMPWRMDFAVGRRSRPAPEAAGIEAQVELSPELPHWAADTGVEALPRAEPRVHNPSLVDVSLVERTAAERRGVTGYIAKRYRVADEVIENLVATTYRVAAQAKLDPMLILSVMAIESRFNPIAESVLGAKGLMQVIAKFHPEKVEPYGGEDALFDPEVNIRVGAAVLSEYVRRFGDLEVALQSYAGALEDSSAQYARKVFAERARLMAASSRARPEA